MNRWLRFAVMFAVLAALVCIVSVSASAAEDFSSLDFLDAEGFTSVLTDGSGTERSFDGVLDLSTLESNACVEQIACYAVYNGTDCVLEVRLHGVSAQEAYLFGEGQVNVLNGWYSALFDMDETNEVFLTGLTAGNLLQVQTELVEARLEDRYFSMEHVDFIDTEKDFAGDSNLCWAAACADMLYYTGWAEAAGMENADDTFEAYIGAFDDTPGNPIYGLEWFFNGLNRPQDLGWSGWAYVKDNYGSFKGYLPAYPADGAYQVSDKDYGLELEHNMQLLREGHGLSLMIGWYWDDIRNGGHLITAWGYVRDKAATGKQAYPALFVSDSDSDITYGEERRNAPNRYRLLTMEPYDAFGMDTYRLDYKEETYALIDEFLALQPYADHADPETAGTMDKFQTPDLILNSVYLMGADEDDTVEAGQPVWAEVSFYNHSNADMAVDFDYSVCVYDGSGTLVSTASHSCPGPAALSSTQPELVGLGTLPEGAYTLTVTVNPAHTRQEAYYGNNSYTMPFAVTDLGLGDPGASVSLTMGPDDTDAFLSYSGLDFTDVTYRLHLAYEVDGSWICGPMLEEQTDASLLTELCVPEYRGSKVKAVVFVLPDQPGQLGFAVESSALELQYTLAEPSDAPGNTGTYTDLNAGDTALAEGEAFCFTVSNRSQGGRAVSCSAEVVAVRDLDGQELVLHSWDPVSLAAGETSEVYTLTRWTETCSGTYTVYAQVSGSWGVSRTVLGKLNFITDEVIFGTPGVILDGLSADLFCDVYSPDDGTFYLEYGLTKENTDWQYMGYTKNGNIYACLEEDLLLAPESTYYWRIECGYESDVFCPWQTVTTPSFKEIAVELPLSRTETLQTERSDLYFYADIPQDGYYSIEVSGDDSASLYCLQDGGWYYRGYFYEDEPLTKTFYLTQGRTCFLIQRLQTATVCLRSADDSVQSISVPTAAVSSDDPFSLNASVSVQVPLGTNCALYFDIGTSTEKTDTYILFIDSVTDSTVEKTETGIAVQPGETYLFRGRLVDKDSGETYSGEWQSFTMPPADATELQLDVAQTVIFDKGDNAESNAYCYYSFTPTADGSYFVTMCAENGVVYSRDAEDTYWGYFLETNRYKTKNTSVIPLKKGEMVYFKMFNYAAGECSLEISRIGVEAETTVCSDFTMTMNVAGYLPGGTAQLGVEYCLDDGSDSYFREQSVTVSGSGRKTASFETPGCPGEYYMWRAVMRLDGSDYVYTSEWMYAYIRDTYAESVGLNEDLSIPASGSGFYAYEPTSDAWLSIRASGTSGQLLVWDAANWTWQSRDFRTGEPASAELRPEEKYRYGDVYFDRIYFRVLTDHAAAEASVSALATKDYSVETGSASAESTGVTMNLEATVPYGASFKAGFAYGTDQNAVNYVFESRQECGDETLALSLQADVLPQTTYWYRAVLRDADGGSWYGQWKSFTTKAAEDGAVTELQEGVLSQQASSGDYSFTADRDGIFTVTAVGQEGTLLVWQDETAAYRRFDFDASTRSCSVELEKGQRLLLRQSGLSQIMISGGFVLAERASGEIRVQIAPEKTGTYAAAVYTEGGKMLDIAMVKAATLNPVSAELSAGAAAVCVKVFCVDGTGFMPLDRTMAAAVPQQ